ncbi:hypothetical protein QYE76_036238 [Lolium multiflorum]|uniref:Uncharacterized protein n=1 Tax=Lolium multiflorum TaxID=4521 RepID=A0AAD8R215_LOLMU|nr:hypothetical protein QYE76_036238 [Lolium multiflorum]
MRDSAAAPPMPAEKPGSPKKRGKTEVSESLFRLWFSTTEFDKDGAALQSRLDTGNWGSVQLACVKIREPYVERWRWSAVGLC